MWLPCLVSLLLDLLTIVSGLKVFSAFYEGLHTSGTDWDDAKTWGLVCCVGLLLALVNTLLFRDRVRVVMAGSNVRHPVLLWLFPFPAVLFLAGGFVGVAIMNLAR